MYDNDTYMLMPLQLVDHVNDSHQLCCSSYSPILIEVHYEAVQIDVDQARY